jgi:hypothetical protein
MENGLVKLGRYAVVFLSVGIAVQAMRYMAVPANIWLGVDDGIRHVIERVPLQALTHMIFGPIALFAGAFQFLPKLRAPRPRLHRWTGRVYMIASLISGVGALATAPFASATHRRLRLRLLGSLADVEHGGARRALGPLVRHI